MIEVFGVKIVLAALYGQLLIGLINGAFYAMLSLGLAVIFGLLNIINFAHGALYPALMAQHSLDSIAFDVPPGIRTEVPEPQNDTSPEERLSLLDLAWACAGRMAPKTFDPLRARGVRPIYPYLDPDLVQTSSSVSWTVKSARGREKSLLKTMLARHVPEALVYRRKSGFTPPYRTTLASAPLQAFLHDVMLAPANPLLEWCNVALIRDLVTRAGSGSHLSAGAVDFLWTLAFTSGWLQQVTAARTVSERSVA